MLVLVFFPLDFFFYQSGAWPAFPPPSSQHWSIVCPVWPQLLFVQSFSSFEDFEDLPLPFPFSPFDFEVAANMAALVLLIVSSISSDDIGGACNL
jgi:hypothetical protein